MSFIQSYCSLAFSYVFPQIHQQSWNRMKELFLKVLFHVGRIHYERWILQRLQGNEWKMQRRWRR